MRRLIIQITAFFIQNPFIGNFFRGQIHTGRGKGFCAPGLNCYSCPAAAFSCPIGSLQNFLRGAAASVSLFVAGFLLTAGALFGRFICGFVCPMGFLQDLIYKIPGRKFILRLRFLSYLRYAVLIVFVIALPLFAREMLHFGGETVRLEGRAWFCAYICPSGTIFAAWPLAAANGFIRDMLGGLFVFKTLLALSLIAASALINRFFCRVLCPLGAIYGLFNKISLVCVSHLPDACTSCKKCDAACKLKLAPIKETTHPDCMRCGDCVRACDEKALKYGK